ncbi:MYG1 family protein [Kiritimatiellaeota bacterium B1221]|nr:MYG1 family protein [Kiritimatiellaeota bacterium B1221]
MTFLVCSVLAVEFSLPVCGRDPAEAELADTVVFVVDVGGQHDPELLNFDPHQFTFDHTFICPLSLVFQYLGV